jgi:hypothetical protein
VRGATTGLKPLPFSPLDVGRALFTVVVVLTALSVTGHGLQYFYGTHRFLQYVRLFNISGEANIPTWFTSIALFSSAILLSGIANQERERGEQRFLRHWWVLVLGFVYISLDEVAQIHELAIEPLRNRFGTRGVLYHAWVIPATGIVVLLLLGYVRFLAHLPPAIRQLFIASGAVYVGGALGLEFVSGYVDDFHPGKTLTRGALATLEDFLEMSGVVLFIYSLMMYRLRI